MDSIFDLAALQGTGEHLNTQKHFQEELKGIDHPEAIRALGKVVVLLRMLAGSLWDGTQGLEMGRQTQGRIDATVMADLGIAIEDHCRSHGGGV